MAHHPQHKPDPHASSSTGVSYQNAHTYSFVPSSAGASKTTTSDDTNTPGAYFRLGGYSDIESSASDLAPFYPRQHITDEGGKANALAHSPGAASPAHGIALACSGRMLLRAGEKLYMHSTGAMHIDTEDTLKVNSHKEMSIHADKTISMTSGQDMSITIDAGNSTGDVTINAKKKTINVAGDEYEKVTKDKYSYFQADSYSIQMGRQTNVTLGGKFSIWIGASLTFNLAIDVVFSAATSFAFFIVKFDAGIWKFDFFGQKIDIQKGEIKVNAWTTKAAAASSSSSAANVNNNAVQSSNTAANVDNNAVRSRSNAIDLGVGGPRVRSNAISVHV
jgi:hypothetical protein